MSKLVGNFLNGRPQVVRLILFMYISSIIHEDCVDNSYETDKNRNIMNISGQKRVAGNKLAKKMDFQKLKGEKGRNKIMIKQAKERTYSYSH